MRPPVRHHITRKAMNPNNMIKNQNSHLLDRRAVRQRDKMHGFGKPINKVIARKQSMKLFSTPESTSKARPFTKCPESSRLLFPSHRPYQRAR